MSEIFDIRLAREEIFRLEAELAAANDHADEWYQGCKTYEARIARLEAALRKYGTHQFWHCDYVKVQTDALDIITDDRLPCTCGFAAVQATLETKGESDVP